MAHDIDKPFYLVWCPTGSRPPSHRHENKFSADIEADRLAQLFPGEEFIVLRALNGRCVSSFERTHYVDPDQEVPF